MVVVKDHANGYEYVAPELGSSISEDGMLTKFFIEAKIGAEYWLRCKYCKMTIPYTIISDVIDMYF